MRSPNMSRAAGWRIAIILTLSTPGCGTPNPTSPAAAADDDDDDDFDDDDGSYDDDDVGIPLIDRVTLEVTLDLAPSDDDDDSSAGDDDSSGDDDDSGGTDPGGDSLGVAVQFLHVLSYWWSDGPLFCTQTMASDGRAWFAPNILGTLGVATSCPQLSGYLVVEPGTVLDISKETLDDRPCSEQFLDAKYINYGVRLLTRADPNALPPTYGDFLTMAFMDAQSQSQLGLQLVHADEATTAEGLHAEAQKAGLVYIGAGFLDPAPNSLASSGSLKEVTSQAGDDCPWLAGWSLVIDPTENEFDPTGSIGLEGRIGGSALFTLGYGD